MKKVLYVVSRPLEINTSASVRNKAMIEGLVSLGYEVDLLTTKPDIAHTAYDASLKVEGVNTCYVDLGGIQNAAKLGRRIRFLSPLKRVFLKLTTKGEIYDNLKGIINYTDKVNLDKDYDYIISSSDPKSSHLFVLKLLEKNVDLFHGKWIQIWGDPFSNDITLNNHSNIEKVIDEEKKLLDKADKVVYVSKLTLNEQKKAFVQYADKMMFAPIPYLNKSISKNRDISETDTINLAYCGDYPTRIRNIRPIYDAVKELNNYKLIICGNSDLQLDSNNSIKILNRQAHNKIREIEEKADVLVHLSNKTGSQIPGKIYHYSSTNKPILFLLDGDEQALKEQFETYNRYLFVKNEKECIKEVLTNNSWLTKPFFPVEEFTKETVAKKIMTE